MDLFSKEPIECHMAEILFQTFQPLFLEQWRCPRPCKGIVKPLGYTPHLSRKPFSICTPSIYCLFMEQYVNNSTRKHFNSTLMYIMYKKRQNVFVWVKGVYLVFPYVVFSVRILWIYSYWYYSSVSGDLTKYLPLPLSIPILVISVLIVVVPCH